MRSLSFEYQRHNFIARLSSWVTGILTKQINVFLLFGWLSNAMLMASSLIFEFDYSFFFCCFANIHKQEMFKTRNQYIKQIFMKCDECKMNTFIPFVY